MLMQTGTNYNPLSEIESYKKALVSAAPLSLFRICFGILMFISLVRFWLMGWIEKLYITPHFHFSYYGFEWVKPLGEWTYLIFITCAFSTLMVTLGWKYKWAITVFFLSFTYIELMDKTTYLNHYYFISSLSFLMIFLPAASYFSVDSTSKPIKETIPRWTIDSIKLLLGIVYFYAGLAKLNWDWLVDAMPLKIWLPGRYDIPFIGNILEQEWTAYAFSWGGAAYDLLIPFALLYKPTRKIAFLLVVVFHLLTRVLFPIGMFPYIMIVSAIIFFDSSLHQQILNWLQKTLHLPTSLTKRPLETPKCIDHTSTPRWKVGLIVIFFAWHLLVPFRHLLYPGNLFWTEQGYRYSWRVMLMEKAGSANFKIVDGKSKKQFFVNNRDFLSSFQEKQMSTQPDFIVEYAHYLRDHFSSQGHQDVEVYVDSYIALNGQKSRPYINPTVDLGKVTDSFSNKPWILAFE